MEVISPGTKGLQTYIGNRLLVYIYREFRANEKPGFLPFVRADELSAQFPNLSEAFLRKRLKHCADLQVVAFPFILHLLFLILLGLNLSFIIHMYPSEGIKWTITLGHETQFPHPI